MDNKLKRSRLWILVVLAAIALLAVACGPTATAEPQVVEVETTVEVTRIVEGSPVVETVVETVVEVVTATPEPASEEAETTQEVVKLTVWNHPIFADVDVERALWDELDAAFESEHPGVDVEQIWLPWDDAWTKRVAGIEAGETADISVLGSEMPLTWSTWGAVEPLDDVIEAIGGGDALWYQDACFMDGHHYCATQVANADLLFYRKDILAEAGYDSPPQTWDEWVEMSLAINNPEEDFYALGLNLSQQINLQQQHWALRYANGGEILDKEGKVVIDSPANAETLQFYYDLYHKYQVIPPAAIGAGSMGMVGTSDIEWYGTGKVGMIIPETSGKFLTLQKLYPEIAENTGIAPIPAGASGHTATFARNDALMVHSHSKNIDLAKEYVKFYLTSIEWLEKYSDSCPSVCILKEGCHPTVESEEWYQKALEVMPYGIRAGFSFGSHSANGTYEFMSLDALMVQEVVIEERPIDEVLADYQAQTEAVFYGEGE